MYPGGNPFEPQSAKPVRRAARTTICAAQHRPIGQGAGIRPPYLRPPRADYNMFAVLSPIFAVMVPPAGVVLGHLALPQIRRTGERGRAAAIAGLVLGYLMSVVLIAALVWWLISDSGGGGTRASTSSTASTDAYR